MHFLFIILKFIFILKDLIIKIVSFSMIIFIQNSISKFELIKFQLTLIIFFNLDEYLKIYSLSLYNYSTR